MKLVKKDGKMVKVEKNEYSKKKSLKKPSSKTFKTKSAVLKKGGSDRY